MTWSLFVLSVFVMLAGMWILIRTGQRIAAWQRLHKPDALQGRTGAVEGAIFGLMGLLLAFTFSGAATRFESRRSLIASEANIIGTTYRRLDLLPPEAQPRLRESFRRYVRSRLEVYKKIPDIQAVEAALKKSEALQDTIWEQVVAASEESDRPAVVTLVLSSVNQLIDITTERTVALRAHPPFVIFAMLAATVLAASLLAGYSMSTAGRISGIHILVFMVLVGVSVYVILDYEYPRIGLIRADPIDAVLIETLDKMK